MYFTYLEGFKQEELPIVYPHRQRDGGTGV